MFSEDILDRSVVLYVEHLESTLFINDGNGRFNAESLPMESQLFPVYAFTEGDFDHDGKLDILLGGNTSRAKPETGIYYAGHGLFLKGDGKGTLTPVPSDSSGLFTKGEIRDFKIIKINGKQVISVARNNQNLHFYTSEFKD
jgi:hypothetical protein